MIRPTVTVFMTVYNGEKYLREAIDSVLKQTFTDFELLIVDDGSTDGSAGIISSFTDDRIRTIRHELNLGLIVSRNQGLAESRGRYIAMLDSDDVARPSRLEKQVAFLDSHSDFGLVGGWAELIDAQGKPAGVVWKNFLASELIPSFLLFGNHFVHSTVMLRKSVLPADAYRRPLAEDYDLWVRLAQNTRMCNLPEILVSYRDHEGGISKRRRDDLMQELKKIYIDQLAGLGITPGEDDLYIHRINFTYAGADLADFIEKKAAWLEKLTAANDRLNRYPAGAFRRIVVGRWLSFCSANTRAGLSIWKRFWRSSLSRNIGLSDSTDVLKFLIKCLLRKDKI